ncbi:Rap1a/Tai family immunity protein [Wenxinia marina]
MIEPCTAAAMGNTSRPDATFCLGVIFGLMQMSDMNCYAGLTGRVPTAGTPPSNQAAAQAFVNWARANPSSWGQDYVVGMLLALSATFPCTR